MDKVSAGVQTDLSCFFFFCNRDFVLVLFGIDSCYSLFGINGFECKSGSTEKNQSAVFTFWSSVSIQNFRNASSWRFSPRFVLFFSKTVRLPVIDITVWIWIYRILSGISGISLLRGAGESNVNPVHIHCAYTISRRYYGLTHPRPSDPYPYSWPGRVRQAYETADTCFLYNNILNDNIICHHRRLAIKSYRFSTYYSTSFWPECTNFFFRDRIRVPDFPWRSVVFLCLRQVTCTERTSTIGNIYSFLIGPGFINALQTLQICTMKRAITLLFCWNISFKMTNMQKKKIELKQNLYYFHYFLFVYIKLGIFYLFFYSNQFNVMWFQSEKYVCKRRSQIR